MSSEELKAKVIERLQTIFDPEIPVNIYAMGLIYEIDILPLNNVQIVMTLTAPSCPAAQSLPPAGYTEFLPGACLRAGRAPGIA